MENFYFEKINKESSKFWAVSINTTDTANITDSAMPYELVRRWGRIGEIGRTMRENFHSKYEAISKKNTLVNEKLQKGYKAVL